MKGDPITITDGITTTIEVVRTKGKVVLDIKHPYRFGETVRMGPEQALELAERLKLEAERCKRS